MFWIKLFTLAAMLLSRLPESVSTSRPSASPLSVNEFKLNNGDILRGKIASPNEEGLVIELDVGGFSPRVPWAKFTQETLRKLVEIPTTARFAQPYIEVPKEVRERIRQRRAQRRSSFTPKQPPARVELPAKGAEFMATVTTPFNLGILAILFFGNLFVAYEIALFRNRPVPLVCGVSALLPGVGPLLFLALPGKEVVYEEATGPVQMANVPDHAPAKHTDVTSSLSMAKAEKSGAAGLQAATFTRADTTFNRRFFETRFPGFFRVVLGEAEKNMVIVITTARDQYMGQRIPRITSNEVHLQTLRGSEVGITIAEITQVQLRPKDAAA